MPATHVVAAGALAGLLSVTGVSVDIVEPTDLLIDRIDGFADAATTAADLSARDLADLRPDAVAHLEDPSPEADGLVAGVRTWSRPGMTVVIELVRSIDDDAAKAVVDQAAAIAVGRGLAAVDPKFAGAWSYRGPVDDGATAISAWTQGPYSVVITVSSDGPDSPTTDPGIARAVLRQADDILARTGAPVELDATLDGSPEPSVPGAGETGTIDRLVGAGLIAAAVAGAITVARRLRGTTR